MNTQEQSSHYDVVVAGGGLAGILAVAKVNQINPTARIALVDRNAALGGRCKSSVEEASEWSFGLGALSQELFEYCDTTLKAGLDSEDLHQFDVRPMASVGCLSGPDLKFIDTELFWGPKGARMIGGLAAAKEWDKVEQAIAGDENAEETGARAFSQTWSGNRKSPAAIVLTHMAHAMGIPDLWSTSGRAFAERARVFQSQLRMGRWTAALEKFCEGLQAAGNLTVLKNSHIGAAFKKDDQWHLTASTGDITAQQLIVAQTPWDALMWLEREHWPTALLNLALKAKPVSMVALTEFVEKPVDLPDLLIIPAEGVQVVYNRGAGEINFQATIDFEMTLQAPECVKAIRRLRRARKKLSNYCEQLKTRGEHISLLPVSWAQPVQATDRKWFKKLGKTNMNSKDLYFCGDGYGNSYNGDANTIQSLTVMSQDFASNIMD
jgi:glycine/D-amino acid oxidase-like deaminating enzyme